MKQDTKNVTLQTLHNLKADIYARAHKRSKELSQAEEDWDKIARKLQAVRKRANYEAARIAYVIQIVRLRA